MKFFKIFKIKTVFLSAALIVLSGLFAVLFFCSEAGGENAATKSQRISFLKSLGVSADEKSETLKAVTVPTEFHSVYKRYNELQKKAGYDLFEYKGAKATLYTYTVQGGEIGYCANLLVYKNRIIGGDISSASLDGEMLPLKKEEIKRCLK